MIDHPIGATAPPTDRRVAMFELAAGPVLFALGLAVTYFVQEIGALDRAKVQGFIGLPLMALAPGFAGLAGRATEVRSRARRIIRATAAGIGVLATWTTAVSLTFVRCRPIDSPLEALPDAMVVGLLAVITYGVAGTMSLGSAAGGGRWVAIAVGAGTFVSLAAMSVLIIFAVLFPPLSCAPPH
jgi:hypothetical protein